MVFSWPVENFPPLASLLVNFVLKKERNTEVERNSRFEHAQAWAVQGFTTLGKRGTGVEKNFQHAQDCAVQGWATP